jgi:hypothetical protein
MVYAARVNNLFFPQKKRLTEQVRNDDANKKQMPVTKTI